MRASNPQKKSSNRGCLIALGIFFGLFFIFVLAVGIGIYRLSQDPEVQKVVSVMQEGISIFVDARNAPGSKELRSMGCRDAMVLDTVRLVAFKKSVDEDGADLESDVPPASPLLVCQVGREATIDCEQVVKAYVQAVPDAPDQMLALVQEQKVGGAEDRCSGTYTKDGTYVSPIPANLPLDAGNIESKPKLDPAPPPPTEL